MTQPRQDTPPSTEVALRHAATAAWQASRELRAARFHPAGACPTRSAPYGAADPQARGTHEICAASGCLDLFHEVTTRVLEKLDGADLSRVADLAAFAFRIAGRELVEIGRAERTRLGFPARPTRGDGIPGRVNTALREAHAHQGEWLVALFRIMRSYPFSPRHVCGRWPVAGLVHERATILPGEASSAALVHREIGRVLSIARRVAGHDWVYANLLLPLNAHGSSAELSETLTTVTPDPETAILGAELTRTYQRFRLAGLSPQTAFARTSLEVVGLPAPLLTPELTEALEELEPSVRRAA